MLPIVAVSVKLYTIRIRIGRYINSKTSPSHAVRNIFLIIAAPPCLILLR